MTHTGSPLDDAAAPPLADSEQSPLLSSGHPENDARIAQVVGGSFMIATALGLAEAGARAMSRRPLPSQEASQSDEQ